MEELNEEKMTDKIREEKAKIDERLQKVEIEKDNAFIHEYKELCKKHKRSLNAEIRIRERVAPAVVFYVERDQDGQ